MTRAREASFSRPRVLGRAQFACAPLFVPPPHFEQLAKTWSESSGRVRWVMSASETINRGVTLLPHNGGLVYYLLTDLRGVPAHAPPRTPLRVTHVTNTPLAFHSAFRIISN